MSADPIIDTAELRALAEETFAWSDDVQRTIILGTVSPEVVAVWSDHKSCQHADILARLLSEHGRGPSAESLERVMASHLRIHETARELGDAAQTFGLDRRQLSRLDDAVAMLFHDLCELAGGRTAEVISSALFGATTPFIVLWLRDSGVDEIEGPLPFKDRRRKRSGRSSPKARQRMAPFQPTSHRMEA